MFPRLVRALVAAAALSALLAPSTLAHAELTTANPGPDEVVSGSPTQIVARFSQNLDPSRSSLEVRAPDGTRVVRGGEIDPANPRRLILAVPELEAGTYEVRWTSFSSEDGELARGSYEFAVIAVPSPSASPTAAPTTSAIPSPTDAPSPTASAVAPSATAIPSPQPADAADAGASVLVPIIAAGVVVGAVAVWILRRR